LDVKTILVLVGALIFVPLMLAQTVSGTPEGTAPPPGKTEDQTIISDLRNQVDLNEDIYLPVGGGSMVSIVVPPLDHCPKNQAKTEATLLELERTWAAALGRHDAATIACMLADEFEEADVDGALHTRAQVLDHVPQRKPGSNHLVDLRGHVEGSFGYVRGLNEVMDASGKIVARVRFTDVFSYRDGRWQAILAHESLVGEASR
jgi:ketosteroid isomerase-like protein